jgi:hypothetical protein
VAADRWRWRRFEHDGITFEVFGTRELAAELFERWIAHPIETEYVRRVTEPGVVGDHYSAAWLDPSRHAVDCPRRHGFRTRGENCLACAEKGC